MSTATQYPTASSIDAVGEVEQRGTEYIPDAERHDHPRELTWIWFSAAFGFAVIVLGSLPITFGLSFWSSVSSTLVGTAVGTALFMFMGRFGIRNGTNDAVSSAAHFGVRGRALGSVITIFVAMGFYALAIWTGGETIVHAGHRLVGLPTGNGVLAAAMGVTAIGTALAAIYGHATLLATYKYITVIIAALLALVVIVQLRHFHPSFPGGHYLLGSYFRTWILSVSVAASLPVSYATFSGDYTRYMPSSLSDRVVSAWNGAGMFLSCLTALLIGIFLTTEIPATSAFITGVVEAVPSWLLVPILVIGVLGSVPQGALCLYNAGLAANGLAPRSISRVVSTAVFTVLGLATVYVAVFVFSAINSISAFVLVMLVTITPWLAIMLVGFAMRRGNYFQGELLNLDGRYRFSGGVNPRAFVAFVPAAVVGFLFSNTEIYTGPFVAKVDGLDLSYTSAFIIAAGVYAAAVKWFPETASATVPPRTAVESVAAGDVAGI